MASQGISVHNIPKLIFLAPPSFHHPTSIPISNSPWKITACSVVTSYCISFSSGQFLLLLALFYYYFPHCPSNSSSKPESSLTSHLCHLLHIQILLIPSFFKSCLLLFNYFSFLCSPLFWSSFSQAWIVAIIS